MANWLRTRDLVDLLGVHDSVIRGWCKAGKGPAVYSRTPGGHYLFRPEDVEAWLKSLESRQTDHAGDQGETP